MLHYIISFCHNLTFIVFISYIKHFIFNFSETNWLEKRSGLMTLMNVEGEKRCKDVVKQWVNNKYTNF